jgi:phage shock protein C
VTHKRDGKRKEKTMGTVAQTRRLYRSRTDRKLAGVCGGLAQYSNIDATLIRVLFVVLALLGGPGLVIYLLMWILVPEEPQGTA